MWSPIPGWSQTLTAVSPGNWYATANIAAGNTAVVSYPNAYEEYYYSNTLANFSSISSSFTENMHSTSQTDAEAAYDIWLNDWNNEVMIQHDFSPLRPRCNAAPLATVGFTEPGTGTVQNWNLCEYGSELIWQLPAPGEQSGSVAIKPMLTWLVDHGYLPQNTGLTSLSYGFEICSTGGKPETFTVSQFSISAQSAG